MKVREGSGKDYIAIAAFLVSLGVCLFTVQLHAFDVQAAEIEPSEFLSKQEFLDILKSEDIDRILKATNKIKRMHYQGEILPVVIDLWSQNSNEYPDLPWKVVNSDIVRLELANILAQAEVNGFIDIDTDPLHQYVRGLLSSSDTHVLKHAVQTIFLFDREEDVERLSELARNTKGSVFRSAIIALTLMCNSKAISAIDELAGRETDSSRKLYIEETRETFDPCPA